MNTATPLSEIALQQYRRLRDKASVDLGNRRVDPRTADRICRAWLSLLLRLGGDHPDAAPWIKAAHAEAPDWPNDANRLCAADALSPRAEVALVLEKARDNAFARAIGFDAPNPAHPEHAEGARQHFKNLAALSAALGLNSAVKLPTAAPERKAA